MADPRVKAIRNDRRVGRGSLTWIDETYTDEELTQALDEQAEYGSPVETPAQAIEWALRQEGLLDEHAIEESARMGLFPSDKEQQ